MTNAVLLSAGQGRRLSPLTDEAPKCTVAIGGRSIVEWQVRALLEVGVTDISIVTGFRREAVRATLEAAGLGDAVTYIFNPFYTVADNIGSCWMAREKFGEDTLLINGDTMFDPRIARRVLDDATAPISVTVDRKGDYDSDDMKVRLDGDRLTDIGKKLTAPIDGESIGMLRFTGGGGRMFASVLEDVLGDTAALKFFYLSIIDRIAKGGEVGYVSIEGLPWAEVDFPADIEIAARTVARFAFSEAPAA